MLELSAHQFGFVGLAGSVALVYSLSLLWGGRPKSVLEFFHNRNPVLNGISLASANLGLGTALIAMLFFSNVYGPIYVLIPTGLFLGQWVYSKLTGRLDPKKWSIRGTILSGLNDELDRLAEAKVHFQRIALFFVVATYLMALTYEIYASSDWLAILLLPSPSLTGKVSIVFLVFSVVMVYIMTGGFRTTQITDCLQCAFVVPFIGLVCYLLLSRTPHQSAPVAHAFQWIPADKFGFATVLLAPFTTQIYGVLNHVYASHQETNSEQKRVFLGVRLSLLVVYLLIIGAALQCVFNGGVPMSVIEGWLKECANSSSIGGKCVVAVMVAGMTAMIMSTVDTLVMATSQAGFEAFFGGNSKERIDGGALRTIRVHMFWVYVLVFSTLFFLWIKNIKALSLLYAVSSPCEALAPMIVCLILLAESNRLGVIVRRLPLGLRFIDLFYVLLLATFVVALVAVALALPWVRGIGITVFLISSGLSCVVYFSGPRH